MNILRGYGCAIVMVSLQTLFFAYPSWSQTTIEAQIFPPVRNVEAGNLASAFLTLNNTGSSDAVGCTVQHLTTPPGTTFLYAVVDPQTSAIIGPVNGPFTIPAGGSVKLNVTFATSGGSTPPITFSPTEVFFNVPCTNTASVAALNTTGIDTFTISASAIPVADIVALTSAPGGIVSLPSSTATEPFLIASLNLGSSDQITMSADTGAGTLPLTLLVCEFNATIGNCIAPPSPTTAKTINTGEVTFYAVFVVGQGTPLPLNPATNRVFARFRDSSNIVRGGTSAAVSVTGSPSQPPSGQPQKIEGNFTGGSNFTCSGTGLLENLIECASSSWSGTFQVLITPSGAPGSLSGIWNFSGEGTESPGGGPLEPFTLSSEDFPQDFISVTQSGSTLSGLYSLTTDALEALPESCSLSCPVPGQCTIACQEPTFSCNVACTPATQNCADQFNLSGSTFGNSVEFVVTSNPSVTLSCPGIGTFQAQDQFSTQFQGTVSPTNNP